MGTHYLPLRDAELVTWASNFSLKIGTLVASVGLNATQIGNYADFKDLYVQAYNLTQSGTTRSPANIILKDQAKQALVENTRDLVRIIQSFPGTTDAQRSEMMINIRKTPVKKPKPTVMPGIEVTQVVNHDVWVKLWDSADPDNKGLPKDVLGATVYTYVGTTPPADATQWFCNGTTTRTRAQITVPGDGAATVWITAMWFNNAGSGPGRFPPAQANVASSGAVPVGQTMKIAA